MRPLDDSLRYDFMTGGRMQYMPSPEYLTPSEYGAFRPVMPPAGLPPIRQQPTFMDTWQTVSRGSIFGMAPYTFGGYNPSMDYITQMSLASRRWADTWSAIGGTAADTGISALGGMAGAWAFGGIPGLAVGALLSQAVQPYSWRNDRIRTARMVQNMSVSKVIAGPDMDLALGQGFSLTAAEKFDSTIRKIASKDLLLKEDDVRQMARLGMETGMFDYSLDVEQHKRTLQQLVKNFKATMAILGEPSLKELSKQMQRLQQMGADVSSTIGIVSKEQQFSRMLGISHQEMANTYGQQGAVIFNQYGLTPVYGALQNESNAALFEMGKRLGIFSPAEIARQGGVSGAGQNATQSQAGAMQKIFQYALPYVANDTGTGIDIDKFNKWAGHQISYTDMATEGSKRYSDISFKTAVDSHKADLMTEMTKLLGPSGIRSVIGNTAIDIVEKASIPGLKGEKALHPGLKMLGFSDEEAASMVKLLADKKLREASAKQDKEEQRRLKQNLLTQEEYNTTFFNKYLAGAKEGWNAFKESTASIIPWGGTEQKARESDQKSNKAAGDYTLENFGAGTFESGKDADALFQELQELSEKHEDLEAQAFKEKPREGSAKGINKKLTQISARMQEIKTELDRGISGSSGWTSKVLQDLAGKEYFYKDLSLVDLSGRSLRYREDDDYLAQFIAAKNTSEDDDIIKSGKQKLSGLGIDQAQLEYIAGMYEGKDVDDLGEAGIESAIRGRIKALNPEKEASQINEITQSLTGDPAAMAVIYKAIAKNANNKKLVHQAQKKVEEGKGKFWEVNIDQMKKHSKELDSFYRGFVKKGWFGVADKEDLAAMKESAMKDPRFMDVAVMGTLVSAHARFGNQKFENFHLDQMFREIFDEFNITDKDMQAKIKAGDVSLFAEKIGMPIGNKQYYEQLEKVKTVAAGNGVSDIQDIINLAEKRRGWKKKQAQYFLEEALWDADVRMREALKETKYVNEDMELLKHPYKIATVLEKSKDKIQENSSAYKYLKAVSDTYKPGMDTGTLVMQLLQKGVVGTDFKYSITNMLDQMDSEYTKGSKGAVTSEEAVNSLVKHLTANADETGKILNDVRDLIKQEKEVLAMQKEGAKGDSREEINEKNKIYTRFKRGG